MEILYYLNRKWTRSLAKGYIGFKETSMALTQLSFSDAFRSTISWKCVRLDFLYRFAFNLKIRILFDVFTACNRDWLHIFFMFIKTVWLFSGMQIAMIAEKKWITWVMFFFTMFTIVIPNEAKKKANCCLKQYFRKWLSHLIYAKLVRLLISSVSW